MARELVVRIALADGVHPDDVATDLNAAILCKLEEDDYKITGWSYHSEERYIVRYGRGDRVCAGTLEVCSSYIQAHTKHQLTIEKEG